MPASAYATPVSGRLRIFGASLRMEPYAEHDVLRLRGRVLSLDFRGGALARIAGSVGRMCRDPNRQARLKRSRSAEGWANHRTLPHLSCSPSVYRTVGQMSRLRCPARHIQAMRLRRANGWPSGQRLGWRSSDHRCAYAGCNLMRLLTGGHVREDRSKDFACQFNRPW